MEVYGNVGLTRIDQVGQEYLTRWHYMAGPLVFAISNSVWDQSSEEDQALLKQAAIDAGEKPRWLR